MKGIIAINRLGYIGIDGGLPWKSKQDMQHFKKLTTKLVNGHSPDLLCGHNTLKSLPELEGRHVWEDCCFIEDFPNQIDWLIGGAKTYYKYAHLVTEWHISIINDFTIGDIKVDIDELIALGNNPQVHYYHFDAESTKDKVKAKYIGKNTVTLKKGDVQELVIKHDSGGVIIENGRFSTIYKDMKSFLKDWDLEHNKTKKDNSKFHKISESMASLLDHKNEKYGNSALEPLNIFSGKTKLGQRLDDKLARVKNGKELSKNDVADLIGYLYLVCIEKEWDSFDEFKD